MKLTSRRLLLSLSTIPLLFLHQRAFADGSASGEPTHDAPPSIIAGFRTAYNLSTFPNYQFPSAAYWAAAGNALAEKFHGANAAAIWIVSLYLDNGYTQLGFPSAQRSIPYTRFAPWDYSEAHLSHFDSTGMKVWLQIEPGAADVETLITLVLERYGHHPCVVGLGIDVEWYHAHHFTHGRKVTDVEARRWEQLVQSHNPAYRLFLKHYAQAWMPPQYRGNILFVDDSQQFYSLPALLSEFRMWGAHFYPNQVAFQVGYPADRPWWGDLQDPPAAVGKAVFAEIPNAHGIFWVDFTISQIFPSMPITKKGSLAEKIIPEENISQDSLAEEPRDLSASSLEPSFTLVHSNLNPRSQTIDILLNVPEPAHVRVDVFDGNGRYVGLAVDKTFQAGGYRLPWQPPQRRKQNSESELYYYSMKTTQRTLTKSLLINGSKVQSPERHEADSHSPRHTR